VIARCGPAANEGDCAGRIVASEGGAHWAFEGALTMSNAGIVLEEAAALPLPAAGVVDCARLTAVDSAAVTVLLAIKRRAADAGCELRFAGVPDPLVLLADVYDVADLLGVS
jgi:phospholipid transport system transporter-binding protein